MIDKIQPYQTMTEADKDELLSYLKDIKLDVQELMNKTRFLMDKISAADKVVHIDWSKQSDTQQNNATFNYLRILSEDVMMSLLNLYNLTVSYTPAIKDGDFVMYDPADGEVAGQIDPWLPDVKLYQNAVPITLTDDSK